MSLEVPASAASSSVLEPAWNQPVVPEAFNVRDDTSANWVIRQIVERRRYAERCAEWCEGEQRRARRDEEFFLFRYGNQLAEFIRRRITENGGRRKSVGLPAGVAGFRAEAEKIIIDDEDAVLAWARKLHPDFITTVERLSKSSLNQHIETTGEVPDVGVHIEPAREKFYVK